MSVDKKTYELIDLALTRFTLDELNKFAEHEFYSDDEKLRDFERILGPKISARIALEVEQSWERIKDVVRKLQKQK